MRNGEHFQFGNQDEGLEGEKEKETRLQMMMAAVAMMFYLS